MSEYDETPGPDTDLIGEEDLDRVADDDSELDEDNTGLWDGDRGNLDARQRDVLVSLLKKAFVSSDDRADWRTLVRDPGPIATNLNNLYFNLVVDERSEVAYAAPVRTADTHFRTLVRDAANNREETLLLIYLRERFRSETVTGAAHVFVDTMAMHEYVERFRPASATDKVADDKRVANAITGLVVSGLLVRTDDDSRYRVHRAIEVLLPLTRLTQLLDSFRQVNAGRTPTGVDDAGQVDSGQVDSGQASVGQDDQDDDPGRTAPPAATPHPDEEPA